MNPEAVTHLTELVKRPSVNPMGRTDINPETLHESRVTDYLEAELAKLGVVVTRTPVAPGRDNLTAHFGPSESRGHYLWECHQDTVPVDGMSIAPFKAEVRDGRLYGRGACDVKGGAAAMLTAFARLVRENRPGAAITLAFTVDEEHTFLGVQALTKMGLKVDGAIVAEPTGLDVVTAHKGVARWSIETAGRACHSSTPQLGLNAVYAMAPLIRAIEGVAQRLATGPADVLLGAPTLSLGVIAGGVSPNTVPDRCRIDLDRRLIPGETPDAARQVVIDTLRESCKGVAFTASPLAFACPALSPKLSAALCEKLLIAARESKPAAKSAAVPYGTDASTLAESGIPSVVFGPGDIAQAHTHDEWIDLAELAAAVEVLVRFAR